MVRLQPDMLEALDKLASETGVSRPEALRFAFAEWAIGSGFSNSKWLRNEQPVITILRNSEIVAIRDASGIDDVSEAIPVILHSWLKDNGYLKADE